MPNGQEYTEESEIGMVSPRSPKLHMVSISVFLIASIVACCAAVAKDCNEITKDSPFLEGFYTAALRLNNVYIANHEPKKSLLLIENLLTFEQNEYCTKILATMIFDVVEYYCRIGDTLTALESSALMGNLNGNQFVLEFRQKTKELLKKYGIQESPDTSATILGL